MFIVWVNELFIKILSNALCLPSRSLLAEGGVERLVYIANSKGKYSPKVVKFASSVSIQFASPGFCCYCGLLHMRVNHKIYMCTHRILGKKGCRNIERN